MTNLKEEQPESRQESANDAMTQDEIVSWAFIAALTGILIYGYWNTLARISEAWEDPQYSHGYLIPLCAVFLLWLRRETFHAIPVSHRWWGVGLIGFGIVLRIVGTHFNIFTFDNISFLPCLMGIFVLVGGLNSLRWAGPAIAFLIFMLPLPDFMLEHMIRPLKRMGTVSSEYALQTLGVDCNRQGNVILLNNKAAKTEKLEVADQCSGLRMSNVFMAMAAAVAIMMTTRPWWERAFVLASAIPIALTVNVIRITATGLLYDANVAIESETIHDWAGLVMMPIALVFLFLEVHILASLIIETSPEEAARVGFTGIQGTATIPPQMPGSVPPKMPTGAPPKMS